MTQTGEFKEFINNTFKRIHHDMQQKIICKEPKDIVFSEDQGNDNNSKNEDFKGRIQLIYEQIWIGV